MSFINIFIFTLFIFINKTWSSCVLHIPKEFGPTAPLLIDETNKHFIYPLKPLTKVLEINENDKVIANCPKQFITINGFSTNQLFTILTCVKKTNFKLPDGKIEAFKNIRCSSNPILTTKEIGRCSFGHLIEIGFKSIASSFIPIMDICYNKITAGPLWAHTLIPTAILDNESNVKKKSVVSLSIDEVPAGTPIIKSYIRSEQRKMLFEIMNGKQDLVDKYIPNTGDNFFARGLLIRRSEQFYAAQQYSTHFHINALPIWQCINEANWRLIGEEIKKYATFTGDLEVYAGGINTLRLPFSPSDDRDIFLARNKNTGAPAVFVPKLLFRLVYNRKERTAMVYITINNPHLILNSNNIPGDYVICREYKGCLLRMTQNFQNPLKGYSYCCLYPDFLNDVTVQSIGLPHLPYVGPLNF